LTTVLIINSKEKDKIFSM